MSKDDKPVLIDVIDAAKGSAEAFCEQGYLITWPDQGPNVYAHTFFPNINAVFQLGSVNTVDKLMQTIRRLCVPPAKHAREPDHGKTLFQTDFASAMQRRYKEVAQKGMSYNVLTTTMNFQRQDVYQGGIKDLTFDSKIKTKPYYHSFKNYGRELTSSDAQRDRALAMYDVAMKLADSPEIRQRYLDMLKREKIGFSFGGFAVFGMNMALKKAVTQYAENEGIPMVHGYKPSANEKRIYTPVLQEDQTYGVSGLFRLPDHYFNQLNLTAYENSNGTKILYDANAAELYCEFLNEQQEKYQRNLLETGKFSL